MTHLLVIALLSVLLIILTPVACATIKPLVTLVLRSASRLVQPAGIAAFVIFWGYLLFMVFSAPHP